MLTHVAPTEHIPRKILDQEFKNATGEAFTRRDIHFATEGHALHAIALAWPGEEIVTRSLSANLRLYPEEVDSVQLLGQRSQWSGSMTEQD